MPEPSQLESRVTVLEAALAALAEELVTRRVAVVGDDGVARVILSAGLRTGSVLVRLDRPAGQATGIELFASEPEHETPVLGLCEVSAGEVAILIEATGADELRPEPPDR